MSYCRVGEDSDLYIVRTIYNRFEVGIGNVSSPEWNCYRCKLNKHRETSITGSLEGLLDHLVAHEIAGHKVPSTTYKRVKVEMELEYMQNAREELNNALNEYWRLKDKTSEDINNILQKRRAALNSANETLASKIKVAAETGQDVRAVREQLEHKISDLQILVLEAREAQNSLYGGN